MTSQVAYDVPSFGGFIGAAGSDFVDFPAPSSLLFLSNSMTVDSLSFL